MQATLKVSGSELTAELLEKIRSLFNGNSKDFDVTISVKKRESSEATKARIDNAIASIEMGENLQQYSPEEYETLVKQLTQK